MGLFGTILGIAGTALNLFGQKKEADAREQSAQKNSQLMQEEANYQEFRTSRKLEDLAEYKDKLIARQRVLFAKAGVVIDQDTAQAVVDDSLAQFEKDKGIIRMEGDFNVRRARAGAQSFQDEAKSARTAGYINMGTTLLNSASAIWG